MLTCEHRSPPVGRVARRGMQQATYNVRRNDIRCSTTRNAARCNMRHATACSLMWSVGLQVEASTTLQKRLGNTYVRDRTPRLCSTSLRYSAAWPGQAQSRCRCGRDEPSPGAHVSGLRPVPMQMWAGASSVPVQMRQGETRPGAVWQGQAQSVPAQMWQGRAQSRCSCGRGEPSPHEVRNRLSCRRSASVFSGLVSLLLPRPHATDELAAGRLLLFSYGTRATRQCNVPRGVRPLRAACRRPRTIGAAPPRPRAGI